MSKTPTNPNHSSGDSTGPETPTGPDGQEAANDEAVNDEWFLDSTGATCEAWLPAANHRSGGVLVGPRATDVIDAHSKFVIGAVSIATTNEMVSAVDVTTVIIAACLRLGTPRLLVVDRGLEHNNDAVRRLCQVLGIKLVVGDRAAATAFTDGLL